MLNMVSEHSIKVEINIFMRLKGLPKAVEFAHSGKMKGKLVVLIN